MRIIDGNIFEAMRMVLPEHREMMNQLERTRSQQKSPSLSEDQWTDMQYLLQEAMQTNRQIRITLFRPHGNILQTGRPVLKNGRLYLLTEAGLMPVTISNVISIELLAASGN